MKFLGRPVSLAGRLVARLLSWLVLIPLWRRLWRWAGEVDERRAADLEATASAAGMTVDEYRRDLRRQAREAKQAAKADPVAVERDALEAEQRELNAESRRLNQLAKSNYVEADRLAGLLLPRLDELARRIEQFTDRTMKYGQCPRCANTHADLFQGGRYFRCGFCGARGRWDIYQR